LNEQHLFPPLCHRPNTLRPSYYHFRFIYNAHISQRTTIVRSRLLP
jgi:hypothetical protein